MEIIELVTILKGIDLFSSFLDEELIAFASSINEIEIEPNTLLFEEGDIGRDMFILLEGQLQILKDNRSITSISPIDYIGEMAIIEDKPRSATIISSTKSRLLQITSAQFQDFFSTQPTSLVSLMKTLSCRIRHDTELLAQEFEKANILIHDMRNAITGFLFLDLLEKEDLTPTQQKYIALMQNNRQSLNEMSNEALANAKRLCFNSHLEKNSLAEIIASAKEASIVHPDLKDKTIHSEIDTTIPDFPFYKVDISRVVTNLLINAGQASKKGDSISIKLFKQAGKAVVQIIDHGQGIPAKFQKKIFHPHFTTKENGNGFGLASCKQIIESKHGGELTFKSKSGHGATFMFSLPLSRQSSSNADH